MLNKRYFYLPMKDKRNTWSATAIITKFLTLKIQLCDIISMFSYIIYRKFSTYQILYQELH